MMKLTPIAVINAAREHREDQHHDDDRDDREALALVQPEEVGGVGDREHAAEHEHVAMGEVDQLEDAVDERVAQRDERVDAAVRHADRRHLGEVAGRLDQVHDQPEDDRRDEQEREDRRHAGAREPRAEGRR